MQTTVILDNSVMVHQLHDIITKCQVDKDHWLGVIKAQVVWLQSCKWLGSLMEDPENTQVISVCDSKPYWRVEYLQRPEVYTQIVAKKRGKDVQRTEPVAYKGGRKFPEYSFTKIKDTMRKLYADQDYNMLAMPGYEADDLAAAIVMMNRMLPADKQHRVILATVDADWMGLIDHNTTWFCSFGWLPRVRYSMDDINLWAKKRLGTELSSPKDIWDVKTRLGDKSDNLPAGSPLEVISLIEPPIEHRLWLNPGYSGVVKKYLYEPKSLHARHLEKAETYLRQLGIPRAIKPYNDKETEQPWSQAA